MNVKKAVIPIAGRGTRFLPATKATSKELLPILNRPMIEYVMDEVLHSGLTEVIFITSAASANTLKYYERDFDLEHFLESHNKNGLRDLVREIGSKVKVNFVLQTEQLGLGHAILQAENLIGSDEAFAVLLPDDLTINEQTPVTKQLLDVYYKNNASVIGVMEVPEDKVHLYGVISYSDIIDSKTFMMSGMVEKPKAEEAPSLLATPGRYILTRNIFKYLKMISRGAGSEFQLTDGISLMLESEKVVAHKFDGDRYDTGSLEGYLAATIDFAMKDEKLAKVIREKINALL